MEKIRDFYFIKMNKFIESPVRMYKLGSQKLKKEQLMEGNLYIDRYTEIERENRILLEKMHKIMKFNDKRSDKRTVTSLNYAVRKKYYDKINNENKSLLIRLVNRQSAYSRKQYASDRKKIENRINMISHFNKQQKRSPSPKKSVSIILDIRNLAYKKSITLQNRRIFIEIYKYPQNVKILAIDGYNSEIFRLVISHKEAFEMIGPNEDWDFLIDCLYIEGNTLALYLT